jgi:hypothetical protein
VLLFATEAFFTVGTGGANLSTPASPALAFVLVGLIFFWCRFDAAERRVSIPLWNRILIVALAVVGVPVYFFRTRPRGEAILATLKALAVLLALPLVGGISYALVRAIAG